MSRRSMGFHRVVGAVLIAICAPLARGCALLLAQDSSPHWVPFAATLVQEVHEPALGGVSVSGTITSVYVRNSRGVSYTRTVATTSSAPQLRGGRDVAYLHDWSNQMTYVINFVNKTIRRKSDPSGDQDFAVEPMSRADFDRRHAADLSLGKQMLSGVECEGYKLADPHHKGKYRGEEWFAPSLDFMVVRYSGRLPDGGETTVVVKDLEPGKEPDSSFFRLPEGFKLVK